MRLDRSLADEQLGGDLAVGPAVADEDQHLTFTAGQGVQAGPGGSAPGRRRRCRRPVDGQHPGGDRGVEPRSAVRHHPHRPLQVLCGHALEHEAGRAGPEHARQHLIVVERGERQHRRAALAAAHLAGGLHAVDHGHPRVHQDHVGPQGLDRGEDLAAVGALADDLEAEGVSQDAPQSGSHQLLIVDQQDPDHGVLRGLTSTGSVARTSQPRPPGPASQLPPSDSARSRIPTRPSPVPVSPARSVPSGCPRSA